MNGRTVGQQTPEDIAQEVLIAVCGALSRFRPAETRWMAFVYGIVRNKVIDAYRTAGRDRSEPMEELPDHVDDDRAGPEAAVLRSADRALLHELLAELPELQREVLVSRVALGYSADETARMIGSTPGAVRVTQHRAMVKLRALLAKRLADRELAHSRSTLRNPRSGVHHSTSNAEAVGLRRVNTTSRTSARNSSPSAPSVPPTGPAGTATPATLASPCPLGLVALRRGHRGAVQGEPGIAVQIGALARLRHRAEGELAFGELHLDPGDARAAIGPQGGDRLVLLRVEQRPHPRGERGLGGFDLAPAGHVRTVARATDSS